MHALAQAALGSSLVRLGDVLCAKVDTGYLAAKVFSEKQGTRAAACGNVEHLAARRQAQPLSQPLG
jgi:hypothetical protein